jgi:ketosteroid isomerase-like protein
MATKRFATALEAEAAFYTAFSQRDLNAMMAVWDAADDVVCVHPLGTVLIGAAAVRASFERLLSNQQEMTFMVEERHRSNDGELALHVVREHIRISGKQQPPVAATNAYRLTEEGWRMILHHASPAPEPEPDKAPAPTLH